jgi:4a-hydroxytetrahydrobiopterin dehydratase
MSKLADRDCVPCKGGVPPLTRDELRPLVSQLELGWEAVNDHHLRRTYQFKDFVTALGFVNAAGAIAEEQNHHPDLHLAWGKVTAEIWTHKIDGLTESDFVFAAKLDRAYTAGGK